MAVAARRVAGGSSPRCYTSHADPTIIARKRAASRRAMSAEVPAAFWLGPPPPPAFKYITRALQALVLLLVGCWISLLGGLRLSPRPTETGNDTSQLFNWHPLLITLGFPVLMAEAILAYKAPLLQLKDRSQSKAWHFCMHTLALICTITGVVAAFKSHTLKRPVPMPSLYSAHSWMGCATLGLLTAQYLLGAGAYLWPKLPLRQRIELGPLHSYLGKAIFVSGLATMAAGIQEKQVLLLLTGIAVLYHHAPAGKQEAQTDGETVSLVGPAPSSQELTPGFDGSHVA